MSVSPHSRTIAIVNRACLGLDTQQATRLGEFVNSVRAALIVRAITDFTPTPTAHDVLGVAGRAYLCSHTATTFEDKQVDEQIKMLSNLRNWLDWSDERRLINHCVDHLNEACLSFVAFFNSAAMKSWVGTMPYQYAGIPARLPHSGYQMVRTWGIARDQQIHFAFSGGSFPWRVTNDDKQHAFAGFTEARAFAYGLCGDDDWSLWRLVEVEHV